jgi:hypothetical protein
MIEATDVTEPPASWTAVQREAIEMVRESQERGVTVRVLGSAGVRMHCDHAAELLDQLERPAKDIDVVTLKRCRNQLREVLEGRGYVIDRDMLVAMEGQRYLYRHPDTGLEIDVFVDQLEFCHTLDMRGRLDQHEVTIPLEELVLHKLQIVKLTTKDFMDLATLLAAHDVRDEGGHEQIDAGYIANLLARDWGFHRTAVENLTRVGERVSQVVAHSEPRARAVEGIERLQAAIERVPKSMSWRLRARVGERVQWWQDVDDHLETY